MFDGDRIADELDSYMAEADAEDAATWAEPPDPHFTNPKYLGALVLAEQGYHVIPLNDSVAILKDWPALASTDPEVISNWWRDFPEANIGIATGHKVVVIDQDPRHGGVASLAKLEAQYGKLPVTLTVVTPGGGRHYYFQQPVNFKIKNSIGGLAEGIDVKGYHGYVGAPPSVRVATGKVYSFEVHPSVDWTTVPIAPLPVSWKAAISKAKGHNAKIKAYKRVKPGEVVPEGSRHEAMLGYAMGLRKMGGDSISIYRDLKKWADEHCPGHDDRHCFQMSESMMNYLTLDEQAEERKEKANTSFITASPEEEGPDPDYIDKLDCSETGVMKTIKNVHCILNTSPQWHGVISYDDFAHRAIVMRDLGSELFTKGAEVEDAHVTKIRLALNRAVGVDFGTPLIYDSMLSVAEEHRFHPVRDYLDNLTWDGTKRVGKWLNTYMGAPDDDYTSAVGQAFLISAIARVMSPGCEVDGCLVFEGDQNLGKNSAVNALMPVVKWRGVLGADLARPDTKLDIHGTWFVELQEMVHTRKAAVDELKAFLTETADRVRSPYGRINKRYPRQSVFFGSTDNDCYLKDTTGNRRFWPVACKPVVTNIEGSFTDRDALARDRDQIWAEARDLFLAGVSWKLTAVVKALAKEEAEERMLPDTWDDTVSEMLEGKTEVTITEILVQLNLEIGKTGHLDGTRLADILRRLKWRRFKKRLSPTKRAMVWRPPPVEKKEGAV
jgi:predicted P-loop ATPase